MPFYKLEVIVYFSLWTFAVYYALYKVYKVQTAFENFKDVYGDFKPGWLFGTKKDAADYEWETSLHILRLIYPWVIIHTIISEILRNTCITILPYWQLITSLIFITYSCGVVGLAIIILQPIIFEIFSKFKSKFAIWFCELICLVFISYLKSSQITELNNIQIYMIIVTVYWINLRCLSYYLDKVNLESRHWMHFLSYCLYLPLLFLGPFIMYSSFEKSHHYSAVPLNSRICTLLLNIIRFGLWLLFTEFALHYFYINAISYQPEMVKSFDSWTLYGYGYGMGQLFHLKYVVLYGLSVSFSKFDNAEVPSTPKCIGRIHLYSNMWKYFDQGLYTFLVKYIYRPTLGVGLWYNKILSSFLCFLFVYVWHGLQSHILLWTLLNFLGIVLENLFTNFYKKNMHKFVSINLWWQTQLCCIITSPLLAMSAISNFYFFAGMEIGNTFVQRFFHGSLLHSIILLFFLYCCCYVSIQVEKWELNKLDKKKIKLF